MRAIITSGSRGRLHLAFIDGLRGCAALFVLVHHIWQYSITDPVTPAPRWFSVTSVFKYGSFAVAVFIVVSGYCLMLPALRAGAARQPELRLGEFTRRRAHRILPPYLVALGLSIGLIAVVAALRRPTGTPWDITLPSFTVEKVVSHVFLVHNWFPDLRYAFDPPMWTIALELQIYVVFAIVLVPVWRRLGGLATVGIAFALAGVLVLVGLGSAAPWMFGLFSLGMAAAAIGTTPVDQHPWRQRIPWNRLALVASVVVVVVTVLSERVSDGEIASGLAEIVVGCATALGIVGMSVDQLDRGATTPSRRFLEWKPLREVGLFSYSLYLVHYPIVAALSILWVRELELGVVPTFVVLFATAVPCSLVVAIVFYRLVERRFLNRPVTPSAVRSVATQPAPG